MKKEFLNSKTFSCARCGECCRLIVKVNEGDIKRIRELNLKREEFLHYDNDIKKNTLKQERGVCIFLRKCGNKFVCSIYNQRPEMCRKYPFVKKDLKLTDCRPPGVKRWMPLKELLEENLP